MKPYRARPTSYRPMVLLKGKSGSGKTSAVGSLLERGYRVLVADVESKLDPIMHLSPLVVPIGSRDDYGKLIQVLAGPDRQKYVRDWSGGDWDDVDVVALDSLGEYAMMLSRDMGEMFAASANRYARWTEYGERMLNFLRAHRRLTSQAHVATSPLSVLMTLPITEEHSETGVHEALPLQGKIAARYLNQYFSHVFRLFGQLVEGETRWLLQTTVSEGYECKGPGTHVLPAVVDITEPGGDWTFAHVWARLEIYTMTRQVAEPEQLDEYLAKLKGGHKM